MKPQRILCFQDDLKIPTYLIHRDNISVCGAFYTKNGLSMTNHIYSMAKLADLRSNLSKEEREEYEKFRSNPSKMKDDDKSASSSKSASAEDKGSFKQSFILFRQDYYHFFENVILRRLKDFSP